MDQQHRDLILHKPERAIADDNGCTIDEVHAVLDRHPIEVDRDKYLKRALAMQLLQLDELEVAFRERAIVDRDAASGLLLIKVAERRSTLLGLNAPIGHAVAVVQPEPPNKPTSTERIRALLDNILHVTPRERELLNREEDEGSTPEIRAEINRLRAERGKPPLPDGPAASSTD
jgi:hypothetical protein